MGIQGQQDWAGGIFRAPGGPDGTVYDAINALVTDDHDLLKRGGLLAKATGGLSGNLIALWDGYLIGGRRTVMLDDSVTMQLGVLATDDTHFDHPNIETFAGNPVPTRARGVPFRGIVFWPQPTKTFLVAYAGSRRPAPYASGTVTVTKDSATVTGVATGFVGQAEPGDFIRVGAISRPVLTVDSNTQLTLAQPWDGATTAGATYSLDAVKDVTNLSLKNAASDGPVVIGAVNQRLVVGQNNKVRFSALGNPFVFTATDEWDLPAGARLLGMDSIHDTCIAFTTSGVFAISNMDFDLTDDAGNVQQQLAQISKDLVLWADQGIAGWAGSLIVPALDDVYLLDSSGPQGVISEGIRPLYRSYVKAGHQPGLAAIYRGHYVLPILNSSGVTVDTLVCRLDLRDSRGNTHPAWTRWGGGLLALAIAWVQRSGDGTPKLFVAAPGTLYEATDVFNPSGANKLDIGAAGFDLDVTTRDFDTGGGNRNTVIAAKLRYELVDAASDNPTIAASYSTGPEGASFTALAGSAPEGDGSDPFTWRPAPPVRTRRLRLRLLSSGPSANLKVRVLELLVRSSSRL